jgi:hypothetical protein
MIQAFVDRYMERKGELTETFRQAHPTSYLELVRSVVNVLGDDEDLYGDTIDPNRIHAIDDGNYQGTLLFVIADDGYQPSDYWYVKVYYGSCSGCDTLQAISSYSDDPPTEDQVEQYMTLALHVVQGLRRMSED